MDAKLVVAKGKTSVREIPLEGISTIIGRRNDCSLRIPSPLVSRQHCELTQAGSRLIVKDLGSSNGTFVNGSKIKQKELKAGDTLGVGPITFIVQLGGAAVSPSDTARPHAAVALAGGDDDVADFIVADEVATDDAADFVAAEEVVEAADFVAADDVPAEEVVEAADFVVGEEAPAEAVEEVADFIVGDDGAPATEVADFVVSDESAGTEAPEFVVPEADIPEGETVHDVNVAEFVADDQISEAAPATPVAEAETVFETDSEPEPEPEAKAPKKKTGFFGGLFKKKPKQSPPAAVPTPPAPKTSKAAAPPPPIPAQPVETTTQSPEHEMPDFFVQDDSAPNPNAKPVGDDEMADFLMGLNEKEE
jgi:predicted component of type VI protein secretion system